MATTALKRRPSTKMGHSRSAPPATNSATPTQRTLSPSMTQRSRWSSEGGSHTRSTVSTTPTGRIHRSRTSARRPALTLKGEAATTTDSATVATTIARRAGFASSPETLPHAAAVAQSHVSVKATTISQRARRVASPRVAQPDRRLGLEHPEGEALEDVQAHLSGVVTRVADGEVTSDHQLEVAAPRAEHDGAVYAGRPQDFVEDVLHDLEDREPARAHGLHQPRVAARAERDGVRSTHARHLEGANCLGNGARIRRVVVLDPERLVRGALADAADAGGFPAVEHRAVLGASDLDRGLDERIEIGVGRAACDVVELAARKGEGRAQLDQRLHLAERAGDPVGRGAFQRLGTSEVHRALLPALRTGEVHQLARGQLDDQSLSRLVVDHLPGAVGDGGELAEQVVHAALRMLALEASDAERPVARCGGAAVAARIGGLDADDGALGEQVRAQHLVDLRVVPAEPLEGHR